jgi:hypothetical protein
VFHSSARAELPHLVEAGRDKQSSLSEALGEAVSGSKPMHLPAPGESAARAFPTKTLARLGDIKKACDPRNVFRANFPVLD